MTLIDATADRVFSLIDLTDLSENSTPDRIQRLCQKTMANGHHMAAVCVWPRFVEQATGLLAGSPVAIATVANFPSGNDPLETVLATIQQALQDGATEIDLVFPHAAFLGGDIVSARALLQACRTATAPRLLKVILETGAFPDQVTLADACRLVCECGADFVKTSTGKIPVGATLTAARTLLITLRDHSPHTGIKISGGIRTFTQALDYLALADALMGNAWISPQHFRFGASQLADDPAFHMRST